MLIGRRHLRSNNSWMHNLRNLAKGPDRCAAIVNPADAARLNIATGDSVKVTSRVGSIMFTAEVSDTIAIGAV